MNTVQNRPVDVNDIVLTAEGEELGRHCSSHARTKVAIMKSGRVFLTPDARQFDEVKSLLSLARRMGIDLQKEEIFHPGTLKGIYFQKKNSVVVATPTDDTIDLSQMRLNVYSLLELAVKKGGISDIEVKYNSRESSVVANIDRHWRKFIDQAWEPAYAKQFIRAALAWAGDEGSAERGHVENAHQDGLITGGLPPGLSNVRLVKLVTGFDGEALIMRLQPSTDQGSITFRSLHFPEKQIEQFDALICIASGLVIIAGPTASGKTNTTHAMITRSLELFPYDHWITAEEPIEILRKHHNIDQIDVIRTAKDGDVGASYFAATRAMLRSAPTREFIGEIRDESVAAAAIRAALSGHSVLSTIHTDNVLKVVPRLIDLGVAPSMLKHQGILRGITSQRLFPTLCSECSRKVKIDNWKGYRPDWLTEIFETQGVIRMPNETGGCPRCRDGYRIGQQKVIAEILKVDDDLMDLLLEGKKGAIIDYWRAKGGEPMLDTAKRYVSEGLIDPREVMRCLNF